MTKKTKEAASAAKYAARSATDSRKSPSSKIIEGGKYAKYRETVRKEKDVADKLMTGPRVVGKLVKEGVKAATKKKK